MTGPRVRGQSGGIRRLAAAWILAAAPCALLVISSCTKQSLPPEPIMHVTKAFDATFGEIPRLPLSASSFATVAYFPSSIAPGKFRPVPIFSVESGKEETLAVRTVIRGIERGEGLADALLEEIVLPFPPGSELASFSYDAGLASVTVGGKFRAEVLSDVQKEKAAKALALTVSQFGKAERVEVTDESGRGPFGSVAEGVDIVDIGSPKVLGLVAIRDGEGQPPTVLSVMFDRPVFVEDAAFFPPGGTEPVPGKVYSTGFGMSLELHPEPETAFDPGKEYRVRLVVRDGKGRKASVDQDFRPKAVTRH